MVSRGLQEHPNNWQIPSIQPVYDQYPINPHQNQHWAGCQCCSGPPTHEHHQCPHSLSTNCQKCSETTVIQGCDKDEKTVADHSVLEQAAEWAVEDWKSVVWLYGTKINSIESDGKQWLGNWVGEGLIEQGPENSGILMVGTSWYGSLWTGMLLWNLQGMRGGWIPTGRWTFWMTTYCPAWRNLRFVMMSTFFSKTMTQVHLQKDQKLE